MPMPNPIRVRTAGPQSIESCRLLAILLLVAYHVIGASGDGGLQVTGAHPARLAADFLADLRMPLFAFIAGFVYALRPAQPGQLAGFMTGKLRRLALPGAVAIATFMILSKVMDTRFAPGPDWWLNFFTSYAHYWFLQAILLIFLFYCSLDALTRGRLLLPSLIVSSLIYLLPLRIPSAFMSVNQAFYLLPYFILGIAFLRQAALIDANRKAVMSLCLAVAALAAAASVSEFLETGQLSSNPRDLQSLGFGMAASALCFLVLPPLDLARRIGRFGFTIYLYHVFASSFVRRALQGAGIEDFEVHLVLGIATSIGLPILLHLAAARHPASALLILGQHRFPLRHKVSRTHG